MTPLERENAALVVGLAGVARCVVGCRRLGSGWAEDVGGVLRVTRGGGVEDDGGEDGGERPVEEGEWLYFVGGDGAVRVWSRGSSSEGR